MDGLTIGWSLVRSRLQLPCIVVHCRSTLSVRFCTPSSLLRVLIETAFGMVLVQGQELRRHGRAITSAVSPWRRHCYICRVYHHSKFRTIGKALTGTGAQHSGFQTVMPFTLEPLSQTGSGAPVHQESHGPPTKTAASGSPDMTA